MCYTGSDIIQDFKDYAREKIKEKNYPEYPPEQESIDEDRTIEAKKRRNKWTRTNGTS